MSGRARVTEVRSIGGSEVQIDQPTKE